MITECKFKKNLSMFEFLRMKSQIRDKTMPDDKILTGQAYVSRA